LFRSGTLHVTFSFSFSRRKNEGRQPFISFTCAGGTVMSAPAVWVLRLSALNIEAAEAESDYRCMQK